MRGPALALLLLVPALAGCTQAPPAADVDPAADGEALPSGAGGPAPATDPPAAPGNGTTTARPNATAPNATQPAPREPGASPPIAWPALEDAPVRPGVQTFYGGSQCTSNFVFTSLDNGTVYLGSAAHCFGTGAKLGDPVEIGDGVASGTLAYSSWLTMGHNGGGYVDPQAPGQVEEAACAHEEDPATCEDNDFALIRLEEGAEALAHPAMLHFGGPTGLAPSAGVQMGDKVLTYGNTGLRMGIDPSNWHEGYVLARGGWNTQTYTAPQGVQGDSGSGVLLGDGRALGVLVTVAYAPVPGSNGVTSLDLALAYAKENGGVDVQLATWELLDAGLLPPL